METAIPCKGWRNFQTDGRDDYSSVVHVYRLWLRNIHTVISNPGGFSYFTSITVKYTLHYMSH